MRSTIVSTLANLAASVSLFAVMTGTVHAAGTASLTISGGSVEIGNTISAVIRATSTDPVVSVQADLIFDASKLQCLSVDGSASAFTIPYQGACGAGTVSIARATAGTTLTGTQTVAIVNFKAIAPGTANISFATTSGLYRSPDAAAVWNGNTAGTSISINNAPATPATPTPTAMPATTKPAATATTTPTRAVAAAVTTAATPTPTAEVTATPAPTAAPEVAPTAAPIPVATDTTRAISNTTIGSIIAVIAAGAIALFVVRRKQSE